MVDLLLVQKITFDTLHCDDDSFYLQWHHVIGQISESLTKSLKSGLLDYKYPNNLPKLTKNITSTCKILHDEQTTLFLEYYENLKMKWIAFTKEFDKPYLFSHRYVACPNSTILKFDKGE